MKILFLHHSTGKSIWQAGVQEWFNGYNLEHGTDYQIEELVFPKKRPYGWKNYPFDYWNIWVRNGGQDFFLEEPTLERLTRLYDVIVFKHCFPVSDILPDTGSPSVSSDEKRLENYKLQYDALGEKLRSFPDTTFIVWTGPALTEQTTSPEAGARARAFFTWVKQSWRQPDDNIFIWDFFELQTEGGLYFKTPYAASPYDSHPSEEFATRVATDFCQYIVNVIGRRQLGTTPERTAAIAEG